MKILLVMPHLVRDYSTSSVEDTDNVDYTWYVPAHGIMYVSSYLKSLDFDVTSLNLNHYPYDKIDSVLKENNFDVVCTGGLFTHMQQFEEIVFLAKKYNKNVKTIVGGPVATAHPEFAIDALKADFLVLGEGEHTTAELLSAIKTKAEYRDVKGIAYKKNDRFIQTGIREPITDLDKLPFPDYAGFEYGYYLDNYTNPAYEKTIYLNDNLRSAGIVAGRDCPGKCTFCFRITGGKLRVRSVENVMEEIEFLVDTYGLNDLTILDDVFAIKKSRVYDFCERIKPLNLNWACQLRVPGVDEPLLTAMKNSGCYFISYGFESASNKVLKSMKKGITREQIENVIPITRKAKITFQANFIFGDPVETLETARETLHFVQKYKWLYLGLLFIKPFPGAPLYHDLIESDSIKNLRFFWINSAYDEGFKYINMTSMNDDEMRLLNAMVYVERMDKNYYKATNVSKLKDKEFRLKLQCPVCKKKIMDFKTDKALLLACPHCFMRSHIDPVDLAEFDQIKKMVTKFIRLSFIFSAKIALKSDTVGLFIISLYRSLKSRNKNKLFRRLHLNF